jgi:sugar O-acyltransferase (sialic acid O-acetyltransferase NeuD family)
VSRQELIVFGVGELAQLAAYYFTHDAGRRVEAFALDDALVKESSFDSRPVVALSELPTRFPPGAFDAFVAIGYRRLNQGRAAKCEQLRGLGYRLATYVSTRSSTWPDLKLGDNCFVMEGNTVQPFVQIGNGVIVWCGNLISHHVTIADNVFITSHVAISGGVQIGERSFLGINSTIKENVRVAADVIVGAGALILKDVNANSGYLEHPTAMANAPASRLQALL